MKFTDRDFEIIQLHATFIFEVILRSSQYFRNEAEFYDEEDTEFKLYFEFADYLYDLLKSFNYYNFKEWCDKLDEC